MIVIDRGRLRYDGDLETLSRRYVTHRLVQLQLREHVSLDSIAGEGEVVAHEGLSVTLRVPADETAAVAGRLLSRLPVADVAIEEPPMEDVIRAVFAES